MKKMLIVLTAVVLAGCYDPVPSCTSDTAKSGLNELLYAPIADQVPSGLTFNFKDMRKNPAGVCLANMELGGKATIPIQYTITPTEDDFYIEADVDSQRAGQGQTRAWKLILLEHAKVENPQAFN